MADIKVCRICLKSEVKMYTFDKFYLKTYYEEIMNMKVDARDHLPQSFCYECAALLYKFHKFKEKCHYGQNVLSQICWQGPITNNKVDYVSQSDEYLKPLLTLIDASSKKVKTITIKNKDIKTKARNAIEFVDNDRDSEDALFETTEVEINDTITKSEDEIEFIADNDNDSEDVPFETTKVDIDDTITKSENEMEYVADSNRDSDDAPLKAITKTEADENMEDFWDAEPIEIIPIDNTDEYIDKTQYDTSMHIFVDENKEAVNIQAVELNSSSEKPRKRKKFQNNPNRKTLDMTKWRKYHLSEKEALEQFHAKAQEKYYNRAAYKCTDCFKGFSTENMFKRHNRLRHDRAAGDIVCKYCKFRFKLPCDLSKHMRYHFVRYECLLCKMTLFETSAFLHDEYHSGVTKKCHHCGEEFRHQSTYYSHLRTQHRTSYVCTLCGCSFVTQNGLNNHKRVKHILNEIDSPSDDEPVNTYCKRCDITFETRKAFEEHLLHSVNHAEGIEDAVDEATKKILGAKLLLKGGFTRRNRTRAGNVRPNSKSIRVRNRRTRKKPTTCHQCGKEFETQAACMKHHTKDHPGTSFFPSAERHVCEICGASLAPGSVTMHLNIHTRQKLFPCEICDKVFHSAIGLKRHSVTHTGEKPFACTMCDKRFTQSNSMKLHFRTFHLKQPYPKRVRRTKKEELLDLREETSKASSESTVANAITSDNIHYLTLN